MKHIGFALLVYTAAVARTSLIPRLGLDAAPDVLLALAFPAALIGGAPGLLWGALIGLLSDAIAPAAMGIGVVWTTLLVRLAQRWLRRRPDASLLTKATLAFAMSACLVPAAVLTRCWLAAESIQISLLAATATATALASALLVVAGALLALPPRALLRRRQQAW